MNHLEDAIAAGLDGLRLAVSGAVVSRLAAYLSLLEQWNRAYNLTAVRDVREMVPRHILDSLSILPWLHGERVLDVGSGAGLPGIPLALMSPQRTFTLLDGAGKRTRFMTQVVLELELPNVTVVQSRVEAFRPPQPFDTVVSRAFASVEHFVSLAGSLCARDGRLLAMKGLFPAEELAQLPAGYAVLASHRLDVPGVDGERHLIELVPVATASG
ncbi:16S rRNA (guanine(527)-N(7))-methyltransferase RsmG [Plasticicumulans acidivorans]|uniref:Ribosomal RNA small subunit methyltransferase G n=1 Tax=Plasticicumulans acidivorans TaxID=886464 RepID=A0A317MWK6_9GAMM|nr:16S rRNA (guanine(527)-N(7))-methyltransferase RsmG [Plasticicumulans acidivorans]PWV62364.1 16S rRNA m(7)G-527 methyltransferase [Plasticicumulans acidivorans]